MSESRYANIVQTLDYMLFQHKEPVTIGINGSWGTGKTHFWKSYSEQKVLEEPPLEIAYVSLFGLNSVSSLKKELRSALLPGTSNQSLKKIGEGLVESLRDFKFAGVSIPDEMMGEVLLRRILSSTHTVCLDDLERTAIPDDEVLGFVNMLRDDLKLNVVLIYNEAKIDETESYFKFREKALDRELPFPGSSEHAVEIAISDEKMRPMAVQICELLEIQNIRIIRRAEFFLNEVKSHLDEKTWDIAAHHILHSLLLFCYLQFEQSRAISSIRSH